MDSNSSGADNIDKLSGGGSGAEDFGQLEALTSTWCAKGFKGTCIGSTVLGKKCFFLDVVVEAWDEAREVSSLLRTQHQQTHCGDVTDEKRENGCASETRTAQVTSTTNASVTTTTLHLVGDHVIQTAPRTIQGFMEDAFGTCEIADMTTTAAEEGKREGQGGDADEHNAQNNNIIKPPLFLVSVFCGNNSVYSLSERAFRRVSRLLNGNTNTIALSRTEEEGGVGNRDDTDDANNGNAPPSPSLSPSSSPHQQVPPCPRVGDVLFFPPNCCFSRPIPVRGGGKNNKSNNDDTNNSNIKKAEEGINNQQRCLQQQQQQPFPTRQVFGVHIPVLNARDGMVVVKRGVAPKPADYADRWQLEKKMRGNHKKGAPPPTTTTTTTEAKVGGEDEKAAIATEVKIVGKKTAKPKDDEASLLCGNQDDDPTNAMNNSSDHHHHAKEPHHQNNNNNNNNANKEGRAGHAARFNIVAEWLIRTYGFNPTTTTTTTTAEGTESGENHHQNHRSPIIRILDVAGGSGKLSCELSLRGFHCTVVDPRIVPMKKLHTTMDGMIRQAKHREVTREYYNKSSNLKNNGSNASASLSNLNLGEKRSRSPAAAAEEEKNEDALSTVAAATLPSNSTSAAASTTARAERRAADKITEQQIKEEALGRISLCHALFNEADVNRYYSSSRGDSGESAGDDSNNPLLHDAASPSSLSSSPSSFAELVSACDVIVGLHCDGAVDSIIEAACKYRKNFVIIPCCVFPSVFHRELEVEDEEVMVMEGERGEEMGSASTSDGNNSDDKVATMKRTRKVPVIDRDQLVRWIPQQAKRLGYCDSSSSSSSSSSSIPPRPFIGIDYPQGLVGANACVYGIV